MKYTAFISYRNRVPADEKWARWLHKALEPYRIPRRVRGGAARLGRVFLDTEELPASSDLTHDVLDALDESEFLIVVCSPRRRESEWLRTEVAHARTTKAPGTPIQARSYVVFSESSAIP
jgi:hypothetical protein